LTMTIFRSRFDGAVEAVRASMDNAAVLDPYLQTIKFKVRE
jgi:hypothetical protein